MKFRVPTPLLLSMVAAVAAALFAGAIWKASAADPFRNVARAKGFKWAAGYYPTTNGVQNPTAMIIGSEGRFLSNNVVFVTEPRIESYREDGSLEWIATALDGLVNMSTRTASGTNRVAFQTADTNLYVTARGFLWQQTNRVLILSNETYTWFDRSRTNSPALR